MDKEKQSDNHSPRSWMEMQQFIGDLIASRNLSKNQSDGRPAAWGASAASGGLKVAPVESQQAAVRVRDPAEPGAPPRREAREEVNHGCTCPGCPFSSRPLCVENLRAQQSLSAAPHVSRQLKNPSRHSLPDPPEPGSSSSEQQSSPPHRPRSEDSDAGSQSSPLSLSSGSPSHLSLFPCLCCRRGVQACTPEGADSAFSHTHAHHHFHHHHCPVSSCVPCPQFAHAARLPAPIPCLSCRCSLTPFPQPCRHQHAATPQQEERDPALLSLHPCMHCTASFSRPSQLLQHQRSEHAHKPSGFLCTECGRAFNSHSNLRIHLNVHTGARPYSCADCGKSFSQSGALKIHRRIHTGERPYSCDFCGRGFPHLAGVRAHLRTHTGEKPYGCGLCGKRFTQSGALKIHTRIHTGERPFVCSLCGKGFANRSGIRFHYRTVHGLSAEHSGEPRAAGCSPGRPRNLPPASLGLDTQSVSGSDSLGSSGVPQIHKPQAERREGLLYACEDCGLRFKDAPARNRHQTLVHYSQEGGEEREETQTHDFNHE